MLRPHEVGHGPASWSLPDMTLDDRDIPIQYPHPWTLRPGRLDFPLGGDTKQ